jgi:1,4-alpha-glucan branching enzyme
MNTTTAIAKLTKGNGRQKSVHFALASQNAQAVFVAGTFNNWNPLTTPLRRKDNQLWVADVALPPGTHEYQFVVDGSWTPDPQAPESTPNPFGGVNSMIRVEAPR